MKNRSSFPGRIKGEGNEQDHEYHKSVFMKLLSAVYWMGYKGEIIGEKTK